MNRKARQLGPSAVEQTIEIREMTFNDMRAVFDLGTRLFTPEKWPTLYRAWDEYEIVQLFGSDGEFCLVAEIDARVVGFALGTMMKKPRSSWRYGWLLWLGVAPRMKQRGIGTRLLNQLTDRFIDAGARMMLVDTDDENHDAINLFRKLGFGDAMKHVYLSKNLVSHPSYRRKKSQEEG
ncbi:GNAT family N-acetyltransferase [bacterium]|nr:GNAT family N-acetyltransferase [bacterium]